MSTVFVFTTESRPDSAVIFGQWIVGELRGLDCFVCTLQSLHVLSAIYIQNIERTVHAVGLTTFICSD